MSRDDDTRPEGEAFFSRWSRRKQQKLKHDDAPMAQALEAPRIDPTGTATTLDQPVQPAAQPPGLQSGTTNSERPQTQRALTEDDFADVDFAKLDYTSNYDRFTQTGVPESIRQKALTQLWHSDAIFTQVDPFQDYAGDFTDAATVPVGALKTAYKVGQGFLTDQEAHMWDQLGKPDVSPEISAMPELRPGYRVRRATLADAATLCELQARAILHLSVESYGQDIAESWAAGLSPEMFATRLAEAEAMVDVAIDDNSGAIAAFIGRRGPELQALFVAPGHGRRGLAHRLIEYAIVEVEKSGVTGAISVSASRLSRPIFYRLGFRDIATRQSQTRGGALMEVFDMSRTIITDSSLNLAAETPDQPDVRAFFAASEAYMSDLYPAESNHFVDAAALMKPNVIFLVARREGIAIGCGAVVKADDGSGEIKRMWIDPATRGLKLGVRLLDALEVAARHDRVSVLRLETGIHQPEAIRLYRRAGFVEIPPFGDYQPDPLSLFMEKGLT